MPEKIKTPVEYTSNAIGVFIVDPKACEVAKVLGADLDERLTKAAAIVRALNSHAALAAACRAALTERTNIGLSKPGFTPGVTKQLKAALAAAGENQDG